MRVIGISGTTTIRTATRVLRNTAPNAVASVDESLAMLRDGRADAFALTHDTRALLAPRVAGSRILEGSFNQIHTSIAVPKKRPNALAYVSKPLDQAKASGVVQKVFDQNGLTMARVPAAGEGRCGSAARLGPGSAGTIGRSVCNRFRTCLGRAIPRQRALHARPPSACFSGHRL